MAICTGLIPAMEIDNIHNITVITNSIATARKILESKVNPLQNIFILLASVAKTFLNLLMTKSKQTHITLYSPASVSS